MHLHTELLFLPICSACGATVTAAAVPIIFWTFLRCYPPFSLLYFALLAAFGGPQSELFTFSAILDFPHHHEVVPCFEPFFIEDGGPRKESKCFLTTSLCLHFCYVSVTAQQSRSSTAFDRFHKIHLHRLLQPVMQVFTPAFSHMRSIQKEPPPPLWISWNPSLC